LRFKLDENVPADAARQLRADGHDVSDVIVEQLAGAGDPRILNAATQENRILLTFDLDFANVRNYPPGTHSRIVVFRLRDQRWRTMEQPLRRLLASDTLETIGKGLAIVTENRVRRKLHKN
jgi:predicted nuclease of predicted toxin-antitoxin system